MKRIVVFASDGVEEIELVVPVDLWRRAGLTVQLVGLQAKLIRASHGIEICCDLTLEQWLATTSDVEAIFLPGGVGAKYLAANKTLVEVLRKALLSQVQVCAICAAPAVVLSANGLLEGYTFTCHPSSLAVIDTGQYSEETCVCSDNLITACAAGEASNLAYRLLQSLGLEEQAQDIWKATFFNTPAVEQSS